MNGDQEGSKDRQQSDTRRQPSRGIVCQPPSNVSRQARLARDPEPRLPMTSSAARITVRRNDESFGP